MVKVSGGNGASIEDAIVISDCNNTIGVEQEYIEVQKRFGNYKLIKQSLLNVEEKMYDFLELEINGEKVDLYFDITAFFGNWDSD